MTVPFILTIWAMIYAALWFLRSRPNSSVAGMAFLWLGPRPIVGETFSRYQVKWAFYSLIWLFFIAAGFSYCEVALARNASSSLWLQGIAFGLALGGTAAAVGTLGFLMKAAKAYFFGPNPPHTDVVNGTAGT
jgi:hypothetical protein